MAIRKNNTLFVFLLLFGLATVINVYKFWDSMSKNICSVFIAEKYCLKWKLYVACDLKVSRKMYLEFTDVRFSK